MKIVEMQSAKVFWLALEEGDELPAALITALESRGLHAGMVSGSGILEASTMIVFDEEASHGASSVDLPTSWQLASLAGEFGALVEGASMRLRATLSKQSATGHQTMAGDLAWARVRTAQFVVTAYDVTPTAIVVKAPVSERKVAPAAAVPRPLRAAPEPELEIYPEPGDIVVHFHFGDCTVVSTDGERLRLRQERDGRLREVSMDALCMVAHEVDANGRKVFRLTRKN